MQKQESAVIYSRLPHGLSPEEQGLYLQVPHLVPGQLPQRRWSSVRASYLCPHEPLVVLSPCKPSVPHTFCSGLSHLSPPLEKETILFTKSPSGFLLDIVCLSEYWAVSLFEKCYPLRCSRCRRTAFAVPSLVPAVWSWFSFLFLCMSHISVPLLPYPLDYKSIGTNKQFH